MKYFLETELNKDYELDSEPFYKVESIQGAEGLGYDIIVSCRCTSHKINMRLDPKSDLRNKVAPKIIEKFSSLCTFEK